MNEEFLSEAEIGERFPGEWVLVEQAEFDEQWRVVRGVVAAHHPSKSAVELVAQERQTIRAPRPFTVRFMGEFADTIYLPGGHLAR